VTNSDRVCFAIANGPTLGFAASDVPLAVRHAIGDRRRVVLGARPHSVRIGEGPHQARVVSNQWLGDQSHLALDVAGKLMVAVSHAPVPAKAGETLRYEIALSSLHVFDADSGAARSHGLEAA
jgi:multiple sugar transport system ATP-binding protein